MVAQVNFFVSNSSEWSFASYLFYGQQFLLFPLFAERKKLLAWYCINILNTDFQNANKERVNSYFLFMTKSAKSLKKMA